MAGRTLAAMSGGVDSSVAALLLTQSGHDVAGVMMKLFENEDVGRDVYSSCCSLADKGDAERVAAQLDIPFYVFNYAQMFRERVMDGFAHSYFRGETPNPCIECNRYLKFGALFERAGELGCSAVATGHYARIEKTGERYLLKRALDSTKDQSYVLYFMTQAQLAKTLLPLGGLTKARVRELAEEHGFVNAKKPDSQDLCFVPDGDYQAFLEQYASAEEGYGNFKDKRGNVLGRHGGIFRYTIGQRRGLGISGRGRLYVTGLDPGTNTVTLGENTELFSTAFDVRDVNMIAAEALFGTQRLEVKIRYSHAAKPAAVMMTDERSVRVEFLEAQRAVTPGQAAVFYDGDTVVGGGIICADR
ncbi:MAG: tRNA 2-thiouridine(34) synthase MnmA [Oscillospiraceae bacterium]|jgi:tRNA-specific 2-thiouridylase|nr:tRNA 2-thiouridine(34) synthase MnmA [Oscillospiraceae bacterium]